jgi:hypothetical protein
VVPSGKILPIGGRWSYVAKDGETAVPKIFDAANVDRLLYHDNIYSAPFAGQTGAWLREGNVDLNGEVVSKDRWLADNVTIQFEGNTRCTAHTKNGLGGYDPRFMREAIAPIQNKLGQFLLNPVVRNILGQVACKISFRFMMDNQRLFIANLSKGRLGHDKANLLGSLLTTQFQLAAMARASQSEDERRDFYLFIDEFHNFSTDAFASILAEARK